MRFEYSPEDGPIAGIEALQTIAIELGRIADALEDEEGSL